MKNSIEFLPKEKQDDLNFLVTEVLKRLPQAEFIILYGSYARNDYVVYDERYEFGKIQFYVSDYDILVVTSGITDGMAGKILDNVEDNYYNKAKDPDRQPPLQFINIDIDKLNKELREARYFYSQIKEEGIILYDSGKFILAERSELNFDEIKEQAQEYFDEKFYNANEFVNLARDSYNRNNYKMSSFNLHQACENYFYAIRLVYTQQNSKQHNLTKLLKSVKKYSNDFIKVFPQDTAEEKRLFALIKAAYVNGRYDPDFIVSQEDIDSLIRKVEMLRDITERICKARIEEYGGKMP